MNSFQRAWVIGLTALSFLIGVAVQAQEPAGPAAGAKQDTLQDAAKVESATPPATTAQPAPKGLPSDTGKKPERTTIQQPERVLQPAKSNWPMAVIREPSQGRPIFITPGEGFYFVMRLTPGLYGEVNFLLRHALEPGVTVPLKPATPPSYHNKEYCVLLLEVPTTAQPGLYDLEVQAASVAHAAKRSVKVVDSFKTKFRFVHLSSMNIGDLTAPNFDEMLPKEINLLAPEFIIATGDYTEWARARDDAASWEKVLKFFELFNAPVYLLCGLHDHEASFADIVANKPIGTIDYGTYHGLLLLDHPGNPIDQDYGQLEWIDADLRKNRDKRFNFLASNSDELSLLDIWRERGNIEQFIKDQKIKLFITGGSTDWDFKEFAQKLKGLDGFHFIRTHEASTALRDRATGFSHYRVIEVDGDNVSYTYADDTAPERLQHSIPTGRLRAYFDSVNDGSTNSIAVTVQNALNQSFADAHVWLRVAKGKGGAKPTVAPGRLVQVLDAGAYWACDVAIDLPDKGAVRVTAAANQADIPPAEPILVEMDGPTDWSFASKTTDFGLSYFSSNAPVTLKLTNNSDAARTCWPVIRVNGTQLQPDREACPRMPLTIEPHKSITVPLVLNLRRVSPGPHVMQVYFLEDPLSRLQRFDVRMGYEAQASGEPDPTP